MTQYRNNKLFYHEDMVWYFSYGTDLAPGRHLVSLAPVTRNGRKNNLYIITLVYHSKLSIYFTIKLMNEYKENSPTYYINSYNNVQNNGSIPSLLKSENIIRKRAFGLKNETGKLHNICGSLISIHRQRSKITAHDLLPFFFKITKIFKNSEPKNQLFRILLLI
jgi:hypothetical protein